MAGGEDWLLRPVLRGLCRYESLKDGTLDLLDIAIMNEATTMDPTRRTLLQVTIEDAQEADRVFDVLMGSEVAPRKKFIQTHARSVENLDI